VDDQEGIRRLLESVEGTGFSSERLRAVLTSVRNQEQYRAEMGARICAWATGHPRDALGMAVDLLAGAIAGLPAGDERATAAGRAHEHVNFALQHLQTDDRQEEHTGE
jgi:hypothetical protein